MPSAKPFPTGQKFGRLKCLLEVSPRRHSSGHYRRWGLFECDCKNKIEADLAKVRCGHTQSCGCLRQDRIVEVVQIHGHTKRKMQSRTFKSWANMTDRCTNPNTPSFSRYGKIGIRICDGLTVFSDFLSVLGECPPTLEIDRWPDRSGNYSCGQCGECRRNGWEMNVRWATIKQQARNKRNNHIITVRGVTGCIAELAERFEIPASRVYRRLRLGWPIDKAFTNLVREALAL